ncbi:MAG TPA: PIG-L family deacetylase, partial [Sphaerochaeta sp.]|nr:PIG-L family deacetylase [Sphaerochaeta sp.]
MASTIRVLVFGAHPDDDDLQCGGTAIKLANAGHTVKFVSCTNGGTGHHEIGGIELVRRRYEEAQRA